MCRLPDVTMSQLLLFKYRIPFRTPFHNANGIIHNREGFILGDGNRLWTEIAPLPGFSIEDMETVRSFLIDSHEVIQENFRHKTLDQLIKIGDINPDLSKLPSVRFGLSMLHEQQAALEQENPLYQYWSGSLADFNVECNAVCGLTHLAELMSQIEQFILDGYKTVKVKITGGGYGASKHILKICREFPDINFRFDANGMLSNAGTHNLLRVLQRCRDNGHLKNLEYIEEPLKWNNLQQVCDLRAYGIPIAADESARSANQVRQLSKYNAFDVLVIKPMLFGSFDEFKELLPMDHKIVLSSSFETAIGRKLLASMALFLNTYNRKAHGLATGHVLADDIGPGILPDAPVIIQKHEPGAGFTPDFNPISVSSQFIEIDHIV